VNSVIPHNVVVSEYLTDCRQALFFNKKLLFIKKLAFDGFYPLLVYNILFWSTSWTIIRLFTFNKILLFFIQLLKLV